MGQQPYRPPAGSVVLDEELFDAPPSDDVVIERHPHAKVADAALGGVKGLGSSIVGLGQLADLLVPGLFLLSDAAAGGGKGSGGRLLEQARGDLTPTSGPQSIGFVLEQLLEFMAPGGIAKGGLSLPRRMGTEALTSGLVSTAQQGDPATSAALAGAMPVVGKVMSAAGRVAGQQAVPLVRAGLKPTVTQLKQMSGASTAGISAQANKLAKFILDNNLAKPEQAEALIVQAERELQAVLAAKNTAVDAPQRAARYLGALERSASRQGLPARDVATIKAAAAELLEQSGFGTTVTRTVLQHSPSGLVGPSGQRVTVPVQQQSRVLRTDMMADEALERARATSRWQTRRQYGEQKGAETEAAKAIERGARDSVKAAIPEAKPVLQKQGQAIEAKKALDRMTQRTENRDALSLPGLVGASHSAVLGFAAQWLRNNQMRAGRYARQLEQAIARKDVEQVTDILARLGVGATSQVAPATSGR